MTVPTAETFTRPDGLTVTLYLGDCLDVLPTLSKVDAVVTDPPYGLNFGDNGWDGNIPEWLTPGQNATKTGIVMFTTTPTTMWDYPRPDCVACWHRHGSPSHNPSGGFNHWSPIMVYGKFKIVVDTYETSAAKTAGQNSYIDHPTPKPVDLFCWMIENATVHSNTVLDPFMGSGTTGVAAVKLGRSFIGIEKEPKYYEIARRRILEALAQPALFQV